MFENESVGMMFVISEFIPLFGGNFSPIEKAREETFNNAIRFVAKMNTVWIGFLKNHKQFIRISDQNSDLDFDIDFDLRNKLRKIADQFPNLELTIENLERLQKLESFK